MLEKSPYLRNSLTDRHEIWHTDAVGPIPRQPRVQHIDFKI